MTMTVRDLMTEDVQALPPNATVAELLELMDHYRIRHVPVVEDGELVGLVSHRDVVRGALGGLDQLPMSQRQQLLQRITVDEVMIEDPETVDPDTDLRQAGELMLENKFGCLPVTEGSSLVGIITEADFVRYVLDLIDRE